MASINDLATAATAALQNSGSTSTNDSVADSGGAGEATTAVSEAPKAEDDGSSAQPIRGALVVLEGLDRSGKTTQVKLLEQRFVELGRKVKTMRFPDRTTTIGQMIDGYLRSQVEMDDHVIHLLFSANRWEAVKTITSLIAEGTTVICDRYYHSGIVYSAAKRNPLLSLPWARAPEVGLPRPDLVLFLDLDEAQAKSRGGWGGEVYERGEMQRRVRELFWGLSMGRIPSDGSGSSAVPTTKVTPPSAGTADAVDEKSGQRSRKTSLTAAPTSPVASAGPVLRFHQEEEDLHVVDASPSVEEVAEEIWKVVRQRVEAVERGEVGRSLRRVS